jgi:flagellar hook-associated protein 2
VTSSVDGLVSGLNTSSLISQLMQVEAAPQTSLKRKVSTEQTVVSAYQSVNGRIASLKTAAYNLGQLSTWRGIKPTSSSTAVTATAVGGLNTTTGSMTFDVKQLARAQVDTARVATSGDVTTSDSVTIQVGAAADPVTIDISADRSAQGIADAINKRGIAVKASVVTTGGSQNILQLTGSKTGTANDFTVTGLEDAGLTQVVAAQDAVLQVGGTDEVGGYSVASGTNTFTGLMAGVTVTVGKVEDGVTLNVASDVDGMAAKMQAFVDAANATLTEIGNQTAYDPDTKQGSPLTGDFSVRQMSQSILSSVSRGLSYDDPDFVADPANPGLKANQITFGSLSRLGIQLDSTGKLKFDSAKFSAAYNADPTGVKNAGIGLSDQFVALANTQTGALTSAITGRKSNIDSMNAQISDWDLRLAARQVVLQKQYTGLETALGNLRNQQSWLSGQIASL